MIWRININKVFGCILLLISGLLIFYQFPGLPRNLSFDEIEFAKLALSLQNHGYTPYSNLATGHSTLYFYILLLSFRLFGITNFALRLPAAIFGVANVLLIFFLLNKALRFTDSKYDWSRSSISFFLSLTFLTTHWYFNFTRFAFEATFLIFLELLSLLCVFLYKETKNKRWIFFSGVWAGFSFLSYTPGRLFFVVPAIYFLFSLRHNKQLKSFFYFVIPFILIILPLIWYLTQHPDIRVDQVSYLNNTSLSFANKLGNFGTNIAKTIGMFFFQGDLNGRQNYPGKPALNPVPSILLLGGLIIAIKRIRLFPNYLFFLYFLISLFPTLLTNPQENPHMLRTVTAIVSVIYFIGLVLIELKGKMKRQKLFWSTVITLLFVSMAYELRTYFVYQAAVFPEAFEYFGKLSELIYKLPKTSK